MSVDEYSFERLNADFFFGLQGYAMEARCRPDPKDDPVCR